MSIKQNSQNNEKKVWATLEIPSSKLVFIYTNKETGKTAMSFAVANDDAITFMVSAQLVAVNKDHTGFRVALPVGSVKLSKYVPGINGAEGTRQELTADKLEDLGYPIA